MQGRGKGGTGGARPPLGHQGALRPQTELAHQKEQPFPSCKTCKCLNGLPSYPCPHCPVSSRGRSTNKSLHALFHLDACFIRWDPLLLLKHTIIAGMETTARMPLKGARSKQEEMCSFFPLQPSSLPPASPNEQSQVAGWHKGNVIYGVLGLAS